MAVGIPARYASSRFPGKPLALLHGQPMIAHVVRRALLADIGPVTVATDDERIARAAEDAGAHVFVSQQPHASGTDRLAEAFAQRDEAIIVNVQGDEPLIDPAAIRAVVRPFHDDPLLPMTTLAHPLRSTNDLMDPNIVKVVCNARGRAMYFSRAAIPYPRQEMTTPALQHVGLYAYRRDFLMQYGQLADCHHGDSEQLEQLKVLHHGYDIAVTVGDFHAVGVDTPEDLEKAERLLNERKN